MGWFVFLVLSCRRCLYVLEINPLSVASFANIFFHSVGFLFVLFKVSFAVQELLSLIRSHFFCLFVFIVITQGHGSEEIFYGLCQRVLGLCFPLCFIVSSLIFSSLLLSAFIFMYAVSQCVNFILFHVVVQFSQHHLLKGLSFLHCIFFFCLLSF